MNTINVLDYTAENILAATDPRHLFAYDTWRIDQKRLVMKWHPDRTGTQSTMDVADKAIKLKTRAEQMDWMEWQFGAYMRKIPGQAEAPPPVDDTVYSYGPSAPKAKTRRTRRTKIDRGALYAAYYRWNSIGLKGHGLNARLAAEFGITMSAANNYVYQIRKAAKGR